jgi:hypothetical protein
VIDAIIGALKQRPYKRAELPNFVQQGFGAIRGDECFFQAVVTILYCGYGLDRQLRMIIFKNVNFVF